jgi:hypothetical protein
MLYRKNESRIREFFRNDETLIFPSIKKVPVKDRSKWYLMGGGVTWDSCPEVIHIEQILGNYHNYQHG